MVSNPRKQKPIKPNLQSGGNINRTDDEYLRKPLGQSNKNEYIGINTEIIITFIAFLFISSGGWQFFSQRLLLGSSGISYGDDFSIYVLIAVALLSLSFVSIAVFWEKARALFTPLFPILVFLIVVLASSLWSVNIANSIRDGLVLCVMVAASVGVSLYFKPAKLSAIIAIALWFSLLMQFLSQILSGDNYAISFSNGELGLAICVNMWAWIENKNAAFFWAIAIFLLSLISILVGDKSSYFVIAILLFTRLSVKFERFMTGRVFYIANKIVLLLFIFTLFGVWFSPHIFKNIIDILDTLGNRAMVGQGFGGLDKPLSLVMIYGLGVIGLIGILLTITYLIIAIIFIPTKSEGRQVLAFGIFALLLSSAAHTNLFGIMTICLFIAIIQNIMPQKGRNIKL